MARKPLRSQLNQIRTWVRQGRTDAWIAHQLEVSGSELREFRRRHDLNAETDDPGDLDLRDEIEAEIEAAAAEEADAAAVDEAEEPEPDDEDAGEGEEDGQEDDKGPRRSEDGKQGDGGKRGDDDGERRPRRRRRGRRGRGGRPGAALQATFDHGEYDGFGMWFDPALQEDPIYSEHWSGHRKVEVTVEPERIVIKRV